MSLYKKFSLLIAISMTPFAYAHEFSVKDLSVGTIHTTTVTSSWCGNLAVSTKLGKKSENGACVYEKETNATGFDYCGPFQLNAYFLERNTGLGFNCAATHVHSNVNGRDGIDEYMLILDDQGHYIGTRNPTGHIDLG